MARAKGRYRRDLTRGHSPTLEVTLLP